MKKLLVGAAALALLVPTATASAEQYADLPGATNLTKVELDAAKTAKPTVGQPAAVKVPGGATDFSDGRIYDVQNPVAKSFDGKTGTLTGTAGRYVQNGSNEYGPVYEYTTEKVNAKVTFKGGKVYDQNGNLVYLPSSTEAATKPGTTKPGNAPVAKPAAKPVSAAVAKATAAAKAKTAKAGAKTLPKTSAAK